MKASGRCPRMTGARLRLGSSVRFRGTMKDNSISLCPCAELDWSNCDLTAEHHPECKANKPAFTIHDPFLRVRDSAGNYRDFPLAGDRVEIAVRGGEEYQYQIYANGQLVPVGDHLRLMALPSFQSSDVVSPGLLYSSPQVIGLICPGCKRESALLEQPNKHHPEKFLIYCRFVDCTGHHSLGSTTLEAIGNW
jgi:hypothetical protein